MKKSIDYNDAIKSEGFSIEENNLVTSAYKIQGLDLVIEQSSKGKKPVYLSHYSNPGIVFFTGLVKFLHSNGIHIPKVKKPEYAYDEFRDSAKGIGLELANAEFPLEYKYHYPSGGTFAKFQQVYEEYLPSLEITVNDGGTIIIYPKTAQKLVANIPKMYPGSDSFHVAYAEFLRESKNHPEQLVSNAILIRRGKKAKQLRFKFD